MGYNTALMVCNDALDQLRVDPDAGRKLATGILIASRNTDGWGSSVSIGNYCNPVSILPSQHADCTQLVLVGQNSIKHIAFLGGTGGRFLWDAEGVFAILAKQLGYNARKAAWRKRADEAQEDGASLRDRATHEQSPSVSAVPVSVPSADHPMEALGKLIRADPEIAWGWHCNLAVPLMDAAGISHARANEAAAHLMQHLFDCDITQHPHYRFGKSGAQSYAEMRIAAEREEDLASAIEARSDKTRSGLAEGESAACKAGDAK